MRRTVLMLLLATTVAAPALAQRQGDDGAMNRREAREQRNAGDGGQRMDQGRQNAPQVRQERVAREPRPMDRGVAQGQPQPQQRDWRQQRAQQNDGAWRGRADRPDTGRAAIEQRSMNERRDAVRAQTDQRGQQADRRDWRQDRPSNRVEARERQDNRDWRNRTDNRDWRDRADNRDWRNRADNRDWNNRSNDNNWRQRDGRGDRNWNRDWRQDRRYDWQGWRNANRDRYRAGRYHAPRGYGYQRWSQGYRLDPWFYGRNYWISDPWYYRLPSVYDDYQWVRYFDDVILVDRRSGLIVDIIHNFFW